MDNNPFDANVLLSEYKEIFINSKTDEDINKFICEKINEFNTRRFPNDSNWTSGNCLWYALILSYRFIYFQPEIYLVNTDHFVVKIYKQYYDHTGKVMVDDASKIYNFDDIRNDENWFNYILRDCFM